MSTPPIIIIIGPHAYHFASLEAAAEFLAAQKSEGEEQ